MFENTMNKLEGGLYPVMLTPFTKSGKIEFEGLEELVNFYLLSGAKGLFANCLSSEMYCLTEDERIELTEHVVKFVKGRVPVLSTGTFSSDIKECVSFTKKLYAKGIDAVIINSNQFVSESDSESMFKSRLDTYMDDTNNIPLGIYECPVPYKRLLSPEIIRWMAESGRFLYFKDTSCDNRQIEDKLRVAKGTNLGLFNANIPTGLHSLEAGASGLSPIGANFFPELYAFVCNNFQNEILKEEVRKVNTFITVIDELVHASYPYSAKWFLTQRGLDISTFTRTEYVPFDTQDYIKFRELYEAFKDIKWLTDKSILVK